MLIEGERSENKREELELMHQQKMAQIEAQDDAAEAGITRDVTMTREKIASEERKKAADIMAKAATPPPAKPGMLGEPGEAEDDGKAAMRAMVDTMANLTDSISRPRKLVRDDKGDVIGVEPGEGKQSKTERSGELDMKAMMAAMSALAESLARPRKIVRDDKGDIIGVEPA
jgi:hypothetical protein